MPDPFSVADEQGIVIAVAHQPARGLDRLVAVDEHGRVRARVAHARAQDRIDAFGALPARVTFELAGNFRIEEGGETGIALDQRARMVGRGARWQSVSSAAMKRAPGGAVHDRARIEALLRAQDRLDLVAVAFLDRALDDDMQMLGAAVALDDRLAGAEIADVQRRPQFVDLARASAGRTADCGCRTIAASHTGLQWGDGRSVRIPGGPSGPPFLPQKLVVFA